MRFRTETFGPVTMIHGDALEILLDLSGRRFGAGLTDPPYSSGGNVRDRAMSTSQKYLQSGTRHAYPRRARLKIFAHVAIMSLDADPELTRQLTIPGYRGRPERLLKLTVAAYDWNCQQHITPRFSEAELTPALQPLRERLAALEAETMTLRAQLAQSEGDR